MFVCLAQISVRRRFEHHCMSAYAREGFFLISQLKIPNFTIFFVKIVVATSSDSASSFFSQCVYGVLRMVETRSDDRTSVPKNKAPK